MIGEIDNTDQGKETNQVISQEPILSLAAGISHKDNN
jgi:hypothetical protein